MNTVGRYSAVLGRSPFIERSAAGKTTIAAYGFPPLPKSFWRSLFSEAHDIALYITGGMSDYTMAVPPAEQQSYPSHIELMALCDGQITGGPSGQDDVVTSLLLAVCEYVLDKGIFVGVGHTLDFQDHLTTNTEMSAFLFTPPEGIDEKRLCKCTKAQAVLNVVPITAGELALARQAGVGKLVDLFEASGVRPVFDFQRASAV